MLNIPCRIDRGASVNHGDSRKVSTLPPEVAQQTTFWRLI